MLKYRIDVMNALKMHGYNTTRIRKEKLIAEGSLQRIRNEIVTADIIDKLCDLLECEVEDIVYHVSNEHEHKNTD